MTFSRWTQRAPGRLRLMRRFPAPLGANRLALSRALFACCVPGKSTPCFPSVVPLLLAWSTLVTSLVVAVLNASRPRAGGLDGMDPTKKPRALECARGVCSDEQLGQQADSAKEASKASPHSMRFTLTFNVSIGSSLSLKLPDQGTPDRNDRQVVISNLLGWGEAAWSSTSCLSNSSEPSQPPRNPW